MNRLMSWQLGIEENSLQDLNIIYIAGYTISK